eukprot:CAMPEP_0179194630 /NCGR_PEP_ID=MMETSP0796-20121207/96737_1 /TAXON_ID=73915 /ORGANISM="Pyrodinium bahamense, Strain pbaha01" /LENGTH=73 /DNA_ID=CAMNT_0020898963 /DNA_START=78 /DNA_END=295 /DNA_ORIENTATION=-
MAAELALPSPAALATARAPGRRPPSSARAELRRSEMRVAQCRFDAAEPPSESALLLMPIEHVRHELNEERRRA